MTKEKRKHGQSHLAYYWDVGKANVLRIGIIVLVILSVVHGISVVYIEQRPSHTPVWNSEGFVPLWIPVVLIVIMLFATFRIRSNGILVGLCLGYLVAAYIFVIPFLYHLRDTARIHDRVYYLQSMWSRIPGIFSPDSQDSCCIYTLVQLYECDTLGLICHEVYSTELFDTFDVSNYVRLDSTSQTVTILVRDEIIHTYPEDDS